MLNSRRRSSGFTIVELLIVIVVIAILAAITVVAYNGIQSRARDNIRKADLSQMARLLQLYKVDNGDSSLYGCGNGYSLAWLTGDYDGTGPMVPVTTCLKQSFIDPAGTTSCGGATCHAYLKITCSDGSSYLFANLETLSQSSTATDATCATGADTTYGSNYFLKID